MTFPIPSGLLTPEEVQRADFQGIMIGGLVALIILSFAILFVLVKVAAEIDELKNRLDRGKVL